MNSDKKTPGTSFPNACNASTGMIIPYYKNIESEDSETLQFDSVFESGNLAIALKVNENEYNLVL